MCVDMVNCLHVLLFIICRKHSVRPQKYNLFENRDELLSDKDIDSYLDEGHLYLAKQAKNEGHYDQALNLLNQIQTAEASFETALVRSTCGFLTLAKIIYLNYVSNNLPICCNLHHFLNARWAENRSKIPGLKSMGTYLGQRCAIFF
jgi:hypothetical protein